MGGEFFRRGWARAGLLGVGSALLLGGLAIVGAGHGYPVQDVRLLSGSAWLASSQVGQATLLDGTSAEVAAQVQVGSPGHALDVVQQGATAYAVDHTAGTLRRVDGATFELSPPQSPIPGAGAGLTAFADLNTVYALDSQRGLLVSADPHTLAPRGQAVSLAAQLTTGAATLDDAGRLWMIDNSTGDLTRVADGQRETHRGVARPGRSLLTLVNGTPVIVDTIGRKAITIQPGTGQISGAIDLDLRPNDTIQISGSPHAQRLYIVASRGVLDICDLAARSCANVVPLDSTNNDLGAAIEADNRLFVPNYTTGQVWIIDLVHPAIVATANVLTPAGRFQLLTRDGVVFFNDPNTERAGVIRLDGSVTHTAKYDPADPSKGLTGNKPQPGTTPVPRQGTQSANRPPTTAPPTGGQIMPPPVNNPPPSVVPPTTQPSNPPPPVPPPTTTPPVPALTITLSTTDPTVNEDINLRVNADTGTPTNAHWDFGDGQQGNGVTTTHHWTAVQTYQVSVRATMPNGQQATTSVSIQVRPLPKVTLTVSVPTGGTVTMWPAAADGTTTGNGTVCPGTCTLDIDKGMKAVLGARPDSGYTFGSPVWGGACTGLGEGTAGTYYCTLTMDADKSVSASFSSPIDPFAGHWVNVDPNPTQWDIKEAQLTPSSATTATVRLWTACTSGQCDLGTATATLTNGGLDASYRSGSATVTIRIVQNSSQQIVIQVHYQFLQVGHRDVTDTMKKG